MTYEDNFYIIGGHDTDGPLKECHVFHMKSSEVCQIASLNYPSFKHVVHHMVG